MKEAFCTRSEDSEKYTEYREKVIDCEILYNPTVDENLKILWPSGVPDSIATTFNSLNLANIRIIQRVKWGIEYFEPIVKERYKNTWPLFLDRIVKLSIIHYGYSDIIALDDAVSRNSLSMLMSRDSSKEATERDIKIGTLFQCLDTYPTKFDAPIRQYLTDGYIEPDEYTVLLKAVDDEREVSSITADLKELWKQYRQGFAIQENEFVNKLSKYVKDNYKKIELLPLISTIEFIRDLHGEDFEQLAVDRIDSMISASPDSFGDHSDLSFFPENYRKIIITKISRVRDKPSIDNLVTALAKGNSWNDDDFADLESYSAEEIEIWLINTNKDYLVDTLQKLFARFKDNDKAKTPLSRFYDALMKLKVRSKLDKMRVEAILDNN